MRLIFTLIFILLFASCSATHQIDGTEKSGFLGNYSMLKDGGEEQASKRYIRKGTKWDRYKKIIIPPIEIWAKTDSDLRDMDNDELEALLSLLHATMRKELKKNFIIVETPGPDVLTLRAAITEGQESHPIRDTLSKLTPFGIVFTYGKRIFTGIHNHVGTVSIEINVVNSMNNERIMAAMDRRAGRKTFDGIFSKWDDMNDAFQVWSEQLGIRLDKLGAGSGLED